MDDNDYVECSHCGELKGIASFRAALEDDKWLTFSVESEDEDEELEEIPLCQKCLCFIYAEFLGFKSTALQ